MPERASVNWAQIRAAYETQGTAVGKLAAQNGVTPSAIYWRINKDGWVREAGSAAPRNRRKVSGTLLGRLYRTIDRKLSQLEARLESDEDMTIADHERETRAIGQLIRNVEKIAELEQAPGTPRTRSDRAAETQAGGDIDAEQIRRELAERILRFREIKRAEPR
jgi:hypothetical protein